MVRITKSLLLSLRDGDPQSVVQGLDVPTLASLIKRANKSYHLGDEPLLTDDVYDLLLDALSERDPTNPLLESVGHPVPIERGASKVALPYYMGSLVKNKGNEQSLASFKAAHPGRYLISDKLDGVSALLCCKAGVPPKLYTRGDGFTGQDISALIDHIGGGLSRYALDQLAAVDASVRGELILPKSATAHGTGVPRNMVSGLVNAKNPNLDLARQVHFVAYSVLSHPGMSPSEQLAWLRVRGMEAVDSITATSADLGLSRLSSRLMTRRAVAPYEIDGLVVSHDQFYSIIAGKNPSHAFAFKSSIVQDTAEVEVTRVEWNTSKDGYLIPTVLFNPVHVGGVTVQRATGFNAQFVQEGRIGPGAVILITRSGDVIPHIIKVLRPATQGTAQMPECNFRWSSSKKHAVAVARESAQQQMRLMEHFFEKAGVAGIRAGAVARLYHAGFTTVGSIMRASVDSIVGAAAGFQQRSAETLVANIERASQHLTLLQLMEASNTFGRGMGEKKLGVILAALPELHTAQGLLHSAVPSPEGLVAIHGVWHPTANAFVSGLVEFRQFLVREQLVELALAVVARVRDNQSSMGTASHGSAMRGHIVVFSGFRDAQLVGWIESRGGKVDNSLTKRTTMLITKASMGASTKVARAQSQGGVDILTVDEFRQRYRAGGIENQ